MTTVAREETVRIEDLFAARTAIRGVARESPIMRCAVLDRQTDNPVYLKAESLQRSGSFKIRGAYNRMSRIEPERRSRGVVAFSSGNHAKAVATAAKLLGTPARVIMPMDASESKIEGAKKLGAEVRLYDRNTEDREALAERLVEETGGTLVPPFDDPYVIAGQGTVGIEISLQAPDVQQIVVPISGGGLISGISIAVKAMLPGVRVVGVEPEAGDDVRQSLRAGRIIEIDPPETIADGLRVTRAGDRTFAIMQRNVDDVVVVSDEEIAMGMRFGFDYLRLILEPSGAAALAAVIAGKVETSGPTAIVLSGGNPSRTTFCELIASAESFELSD